MFYLFIAAISNDVEKVVIKNAGTPFQESSGPDVKKGCETVTLLKTSVDPGPNTVKQEAAKVCRQSKESNTNTPSEESDSQICNSDPGEGSDESDETESDLEVTVLPEMEIMVVYWYCDEVEILIFSCG